jgi:hypothetical protein
MRNYNNVALWTKGYLDAISNGDEVNKNQLEHLILKIKEMIADIEERDNLITDESYQSSTDFQDEDDDDLPF